MLPFPAAWSSPLVVAASLMFVAVPFFVVGLGVVGLGMAGLGIQSRLFDRLSLPRSHLVTASVATMCLLGLALFWLSLLSHDVGVIGAYTFWCAAVALIVHGPSRRRLRALLREPDVRWPLLLCLAAAFVALELDLAILPDPLPSSWAWGDTARERFHMYPDDVVPYAMARRLVMGWDIASGAWAQQGLERGPLQSGLLLIELPVFDLLGHLPFFERAWVPPLYRPYATLLQCTWVAAGFAVLRGLGFSVRGSIGLLASLLPAYFFLMNSIYVWPKLLAGGLVLGVYAALLQRPTTGRRPDALHLGYGAALGGLAMLAHPGAATSLLAFGLLLLAPSRLPRARHVALAACVMAAIVIPWLVLQSRSLERPGFLVRRHLAGVPEEDTRGTLEALRGTYGAFTATSFLAHKAEQMSLVAGTSDLHRGRRHRSASAWERLRMRQRNSLVPALGLLNLGWLVIVGDRILRRGHTGDTLRRVEACLGAGLLGTAIWLGLQLSEAVTYHGSYGTFTLLFIGLAAALACLPRALAIAVLGAHVVGSLALALVGWPEPFGLAPAHLVAAGLVASGLAIGLVRDERARGA